jgi:hypothetical protein
MGLVRARAAGAPSINRALKKWPDGNAGRVGEGSASSTR